MFYILSMNFYCMSFCFWSEHILSLLRLSHNDLKNDSRLDCLQTWLSPGLLVSRLACLQTCLSQDLIVSRLDCLQTTDSRLDCLQIWLSFRLECLQTLLSPDCPFLSLKIDCLSFIYIWIAISINISRGKCLDKPFEDELSLGELCWFH